MIFLGAGASAPFGINTSKELTTFMRNKIETRNPNLLSDIDSFYKENVGIEPDFEMMLTQLTAYTYPSQVDPTHHSLIFANMYSKYKDNYSQLINEMYNEVCSTCTAPFIQGTDKYLEPDKLEEIFTTTYDALIGMPWSRLGLKNTLIFSTNYDPSPNASQTPLAVWGVRVHTALIPLLLLIISIIAILFYDLKGDKKMVLKENLRRKGL